MQHLYVSSNFNFHCSVTITSESCKVVIFGLVLRICDWLISRCAVFFIYIFWRRAPASVYYTDGSDGCWAEPLA